MSANKFPCKSCGAELAYEPGTVTLVCGYCNAVNDISLVAEPLVEIDYHSTLAQLEEGGEHVEVIESRCQSCHAEVQLYARSSSQNCPFCGSGLIAHNISKRLIKVKGVAPFAVPQRRAREQFRVWLSSRWFAPTALKRMASVESDATYKSASGITGLYLPFWTYDCAAATTYVGQRGDHYYVTVPRTQTVNGRTQTVMVQERHTRWSGAAGGVHNAFDDVLVPASNSIPAAQLNALGTWELKAVAAYQDDFLSGFRAESYTVGLPDGFNVARTMMDPVIQGTIRQDIGGDEQRITSMHPTYSNITFKHILLPIWVSAYRYNGKVFRFLVNGQSGEIFGERPYSAWKIAAVVTACLVVITIIVAVSSSR